MLFLLLACQPDEDSSPASLPPDPATADSVDTDPSTFTVDTSLGGGTSDEVPTHTLTIRHTGTWELTPMGGPWRTLTGTLDVVEILDGDELAPVCALNYALTGTESVENCPNCIATFDVSQYLSLGDPSTCTDPELPTAAAQMGWDGSSLWLNWQDSGLWVEWYSGSLIGDTLNFGWEISLGTDIPEEDP